MDDRIRKTLQNKHNIKQISMMHLLNLLQHSFFVSPGRRKMSWPPRSRGHKKFVYWYLSQWNYCNGRGYPFVYGYICLSINLMVGINFITRNFGVTTLYYKWRTMRIDEDPSNGIPCWFGWGGQSLHVRELSIRNKVIIPGRNQNSFRFRRLILLVRDMMT